MGRPKKAESEKKQVIIKRPNWLCLVYPESAPSDWKEQLKDLQVSFAISPLHDKDLWTEKDEKENPEHKAGTAKKAHYHLILCYSSNKTFEQVQNDVSFLNAPRVEVCKDFTMSVRYLIHHDNKEKFKYSKSDIETFGNIDIEKCFKASPDEIFETEMQIIKFCDDNNIYYFCDLVKILFESNKDFLKAISKGETKSFVKDYLYTKMLKMRYAKQDEREDRRDRRNGILPPDKTEKVMTESEIEELVKQATEQEKENLVSKRNKK